MGNNDNRVVTWSALNSFITQNGGSPKKSSGANSLALKYGEFSEYAPMATATSSGVVISDYTGIGGGAYTSNQLVIEKDVTWFNYVAPIVTPSSITVAPDATLNPGQTQQLTATVLPANAADKSVTWSSENASVATVDQNGLVTAVAVGQPVKIYATSNADPSVKGYATITVVDAPVTRYNISWSGDHVSIPGSTSPVTQNEGTSWNGTFVPENGYQIDNITYTGQNVSHSGNTVTVSDLRSDVSITVTASLAPVEPTKHYVYYQSDPVMKVGEGDTSNRDDLGSMNNTSGGMQHINDGDTVVLKFKAITGWKIDSIEPMHSNNDDGWYCDSHDIVQNSEWQWDVTMTGIRNDITLTVTASEITQEVTLDADDVELTVGESKWIPWGLSDDSVEVTSITYAIEDESIAKMSEEEGKEQYVVGVSRGETTAVVTVNGEYTDTVTITVNGIFDNYDIDTTPKHDIFGNIDISNNVVHDSNQGVISINDIPQNLVDQIQIDVDYNPASSNYQDNESGWIPANSITLTSSNVPGRVILRYTVEPYTTAIDAIKAYAAASTESDGKLIVEATYSSSYGVSGVYPTSTDYGRDAIIKLTAPDGSSLQYPIHQRSNISYYSRTNSGKSLDFNSPGMAFYKESGSKPETVDVYGTPGTTLADESTYYFPGSTNIFYPVGISGFQAGEGDASGLVTIAHFGTINGVSGIPDVISGSHGRHVATIPDGFVKVGTINGYAIQWS